MAAVEDLARLEEGSPDARSCLDSFKISCLQCHQFIADVATVVGTEMRFNCKAFECRIFNLIKLIEEEGVVKLVHWVEPKPRNVRF